MERSSEEGEGQRGRSNVFPAACDGRAEAKRLATRQQVNKMTSAPYPAQRGSQRNASARNRRPERQTSAPDACALESGPDERRHATVRGRSRNEASARTGWETMKWRAPSERAVGRGMCATLWSAESGDDRAAGDRGRVEDEAESDRPACNGAPVTRRGRRTCTDRGPAPRARALLQELVAMGALRGMLDRADHTSLVGMEEVIWPHSFYLQNTTPLPLTPPSHAPASPPHA
jgi:hypothetical protein